MITEIFNYNGSNITFKLTSNGLLLNATEMAKPFGKTTKDYLRTQQSKDLLKAISNRLKCPLTDLLIVSKGGIGSGTMMHEDIALDFAQWLSIDFKLWCNDRIKELFKHGFTATDNKLEEIANNPDLLIELANNLKKERSEKLLLKQQNELQTKQLILSAPKVEYYNKVLTSVSTYSTTQIAKELSMSAIKLNKILKDKGIQYKQNGQWVLYSKHQNKDFTKTTTHSFTDAEGNNRTSMQTVWTEKGRKAIHSLINKIQNNG